MRAVNLLPRDLEAERRKRPNPVVLVGAGGALIVAAGLGIALMSAGGALTEKRDALAAAEVRLQLLPEAAETPTQSPEDERLAQEYDARAQALEAALGARIPWDSVLRRFSLVLPDDVWLTSLSAQGAQSATGDPASGVPAGFTILGFTYSHDGVARLLSRLSVVPDLANVQLQSSALSEMSGRDVVEFSIVAEVSPGASA